MCFESKASQFQHSEICIHVFWGEYIPTKRSVPYQTIPILYVALPLRFVSIPDPIYRFMGYVYPWRSVLNGSQTYQLQTKKNSERGQSVIIQRPPRNLL